MMDIKRILKEMIARGASDLHLKVASPPVFRINGTLVFGDYEAPNVQDMAAVCQQILAPAQREQFEGQPEAVHFLDVVLVVLGDHPARRGRRPWHARTLLAREPGDLGSDPPRYRAGPHREGEEP